MSSSVLTDYMAVYTTVNNYMGGVSGKEKQHGKHRLVTYLAVAVTLDIHAIRLPVEGWPPIAGRPLAEARVGPDRLNEKRYCNGSPHIRRSEQGNFPLYGG